jgi:hypothetical protein
MEVVVLHHIHVFDEGEEDVKLIGVYSSEAAASAAITRLQQQPGFCDTPEGFTMSQYSLDMDHWTEGYVTIDPRKNISGLSNSDGH